jgi:glycosyltransferase involved in cell wall biosynthesis
MPTPGKSSGFLKRILRKAKSMAKFLKTPVPHLPNYHVLSPLLLPLYGSPKMRALNAKMINAQVHLAKKRKGIKDPILFVTVPTAMEVIRNERIDCLIYNRSDKHSAFGEADGGYIESLEKELMERADLVLYVSQTLMNEERNLCGGKAVLFDHGVDTQHFSRIPTSQLPEEIKNLPRPIIGWFGGLREHLVDFALLEATAKRYSKGTLLLIGDATSSMENLTQLPNVKWLGPRSFEEIPKLGSSFDVAIMPWQQNDWIKNCNPIKLKEYLSLGLPVVTMDFPEIHRYKDMVRIAQSHEGFLEAIQKALDEDRTEQKANLRREAIRKDSWDQRVLDLLGLCDKILQRKK